MGLTRIRHLVAGTLVVGAAVSTAHANPCISRIDLGVVLDWGVEPPSAFGSFNFRSAYDAGTGRTIVVGGLRNPNPSVNNPIFKMWSWDGFAWTELDIAPLLAQITGGEQILDVRSLSIDPISRVAILNYLLAGSTSVAAAFNIDDLSAPLLPLDDVNNSTSAARSIASVFARDEGKFYLFNRFGGVTTFDPITGTIEPRFLGAVSILSVKESDVVYDADDRRAVIFANVTLGPRTFIYSLDDNTLVETTDPATAPPAGTMRHRLIASPNSGEVYLTGFRVQSDPSAPDDLLLRLVGDNDWTTVDARFRWFEDDLFNTIPSITYDERNGQVVLFGGTLTGGTDNTNDRTLALAIDAPEFAAPPTPVTVPQGNPVSLVALPTARSFYSSVVWRKNGQVLTATAIPALFIPNAGPEDQGVYTAELVSVCGNTMSQEFTLTVTCPGDTDANGVINFSDLNSVLTNFGQPCD